MTNPVLPGVVPQLIRATVAQPAAGADWSCTVPNGTSVQAWPGGPTTGATPIYARLILAYCTLVTGSGNLPAPSSPAVAPVVGGGTFSAATYFWKVTAATPAGETTGSSEVTAAIAANGSAYLSCAPVSGALTYNWYRSTGTGGEGTTPALAGTTIVPFFTDTGAAVTTGAVPGSNTAVPARFPGGRISDNGGKRIAAVSITVNPNGLNVASFTQQLTYFRSAFWDSVGTIGVAGLTGGVNWAATIMAPGWTFGSSTPGLQSADQYSSVELWMETWTSAPLWDGGTVQLF